MNNKALIDYYSGITGLNGIIFNQADTNKLDLDFIISYNTKDLNIDELSFRISEYMIPDVIDLDLDEIYASIINEHGLYFRKFIEEYVRQKLRPIILSADFDKEYLHKKYFSFLNINDYNKASYKLISMIELDLVRYFNYKFFINLKHKEQFEIWYQINSQTQLCEVCGNEFRLITRPDWVYVSTYSCKTCCFNCNIVESNDRAVILESINEFIDSCGFIPPSNYSFVNREFTSRLSNNWQKVILDYAKIGHPSHIENVFGSWFHLLHEGGIIETIRTGRGIKCLAKDGHICNSISEKYIDDWLFEKHIVHEKEPFYPKDPILNPNGRLRADWQVGEVFIEYFGLMSDSEYKMKAYNKLKLCSIMSIKLISIYPNDLNKLADIFQSFERF